VSEGKTKTTTQRMMEEENVFMFIFDYSAKSITMRKQQVSRG
jgi:hypothetical protein